MPTSNASDPRHASTRDPPRDDGPPGLINSLRASADKASEHFSNSSSFMTLIEKIRNNQCKVGVIGLGYVGLPLAVEFAKAGLDVTGFDVDRTKVDSINKGRSYIPDVEQSEMEQCVRAGRLRATTDMAKLADM